MKKKIQIFFLASIFVLLTRINYAQDYRYYIQTPNGTDVPDTYKTLEFSNPDYWRPYWDNYFLQAYPNATQIKLPGEQYSTTTTFNCHGYAWWYVETGERVWIGYSTPGSEEVFWNDGSYVATTETECTKISYSGDHSATPSGTLGYYISKWGNKPLMYHHKDYTPGYGSANQFFKRATPPPPIISYFSQDPDPLYNGGTGYVYAHLSQGTEPITYSWYASYSPTNMTFHFTPQGYRCQVDYYIPYSTLPTINFTCVASNAYGTDVKSYQLHCALYSYSSSASLAFEKNGVLSDENPILISSSDNPGVDVTDYYLINEKITPENKAIKFLIHESEKMKGNTSLDQVELWEVKTNKNEFIAISDEGEVISYKKLETPNQIMLNDTLDITNVLADKDEHKMAVKKGDKLKIKLSENVTSGKDEFYSIFYAQLDSKDAKEQSLENKKLENEYYFRPQLSSVCKKIKDTPKDGIVVEITEDLVIDYFAVVKNEKTAKVEKLKLLEAVNKEKINVRELLTGIDASYNKIGPGEEINFTFESKNNSDEDVSYILKSVGRYEENNPSMNKIGSGIGVANIETKPEKTELIGNYPNPFNPTTNISYNLKENIFVELTIINSLGQEVKKLVSENQVLGNYSIPFDGSKLASGVYFYRLQVGNQVFTRKMMIMK